MPTCALVGTNHKLESIIVRFVLSIRNCYSVTKIMLQVIGLRHAWLFGAPVNSKRTKTKWKICHFRKDTTREHPSKLLHQTLTGLFFVTRKFVEMWYTAVSGVLIAFMSLDADRPGHSGPWRLDERSKIDFAIEKH